VRRFELAGHEFDDAFDQLSAPTRSAVEGAGRRVEVEFLHGVRPDQRRVHLLRADGGAHNALRSGSGLRLLASGASTRASFWLRVRSA
jgi:hypothetical protein